jgi:hypothetical protein
MHEYDVARTAREALRVNLSGDKVRVASAPEGQVEMLLSLVEKRFGRVTPDVCRRISALKPAQLKRAGLRLLDAQRVEDLFAR